jgi:hypothetical protein
MDEAGDLRAEEGDDDREQEQLAVHEAQIECDGAAKDRADQDGTEDLPGHRAGGYGDDIGPRRRHECPTKGQRGTEQQHHGDVREQHDTQRRSGDGAARSGLRQQGHGDRWRVDDHDRGEEYAERDHLIRSAPGEKRNLLPEQHQQRKHRHEPDPELRDEDLEDRRAACANVSPPELGARQEGDQGDGQRADRLELVRRLGGDGVEDRWAEQHTGDQISDDLRKPDGLRDLADRVRRQNQEAERQEGA